MMFPQIADMMNVFHDRLTAMTLQVQQNTSGQTKANIQGQDEVRQAQSSMDQKIARFKHKAKEDVRAQANLITKRNNREAL